MAAARTASKESRPEGVSITIKTGKGYEDTWLGFTGSVEDVRSNIKATFDIEDTDLTLFELVANATKVAHGVTTAVSQLGGTVKASAPAAPPAAPAADEAQQQTGDVFAEAEAEQGEPVNPYTALVSQITATVQEDGKTPVDAAWLKKLYAQNKALFTADTDEAKATKKAWQERGKALSKKT